MMGQALTVATTTAQVAAMQRVAAPGIALFSGTAGMRAAGKTYLPQYQAETDRAYEIRLGLATLFPAYEDCIGVMVGKIFSHGPDADEATEAWLAQYEQDIDGTGRSFRAFFRDVAISAMRDGICFVLSDRTPKAAGATMADERASGARAWLVEVNLASTIGWLVKDGKLESFRYFETHEIPNGQWATKPVQKVREWTPTESRLWAKNAHGEWVLESATTHEFGGVPVVAYYGDRVAYLHGKPPLEAVAFLNIKHWQFSADQDNILRHARFPLKAADEDVRADKSADIVLSASGIICGLKGLRYVEHDGKAIDAGRQAILDIEDQMRRSAGELISSDVEKTAKEAMLESNEGQCWLKSWAVGFAASISASLSDMAAWMGISTPAVVTVDTGWDEAKLQSDMLLALNALRQSGSLSRSAMAHALSEGGILPPGRTVEQELDEQDQEGVLPFGPGE